MSIEINYAKRDNFAGHVQRENSVLFEYVLPNVAISSTSVVLKLVTGNNLLISDIEITCDSTDFDIYIKNREDSPFLVRTFDEGVIKGVADAIDADLSNTPVSDVIDVYQGETHYVEGVDFQLTGNAIDWSLGGAEPVQASTYYVTYDYTVTPELINSNTRYYKQNINKVLRDNANSFTMRNYVNEKYTYMIIKNNDSSNPTGVIAVNLLVGQL